MTLCEKSAVCSSTPGVGAIPTTSEVNRNVRRLAMEPFWTNNNKARYIFLCFTTLCPEDKF